MKKQSILTLVALVAIFALTSCNKYEAKTVTLKTQNDSLNFAYGLAGGESLKGYYFKTDSSEKRIKVFVEAMEKSFNTPNKGELYNIGLEIGGSFKQFKVKGLMGDSTLVFDEKLVKQGMVNGLNSFKEGMTGQQAQEFLQKTMARIQNERMAKQPAQGPMQQGAPQQAPQPAN
jgi:FKBP-type peptidyl-prolyl cis-trans isomerase FklB